MRKKLYEDVETIYKVTSVIFPDEEEIEEFGSKEDAMEYAQEQISSGNYEEVIVSEVTIDEDGYEDETILLDEQGDHEDDEEYEPQLTTDPMHAGQWYESLHEESGQSERTEQDWEDELKDNNSEISHVINSLQSELNRGVPYADAINLTIDAIHDAFISGDERDLDTHLAVARVSYLDKDYRRGDEYPEIEVFYRVYFTNKDGDELYAVDDNDFHFKADYKTRRKALAAMKKILKDPKVQADPEIGGCHSVFTVDEDEWDEDSEGYYNFYGYEPFEIVDWVDKEELEESFKSKDKYSVLREALDRLDEEDSRGKKINARAQIRNLRSKLRESKPDKDLKIITEPKEDKSTIRFWAADNNDLDDGELFKTKEEAIEHANSSNEWVRVYKGDFSLLMTPKWDPEIVWIKADQDKIEELKEDISIKGKMKTILDFFTKEDIEGIARVGGYSLLLAEEAVEGKIGPYMKRMGLEDDDDWFVKGVKWRVKRKFGIDKKEQFKNLSPEDIISLCYIIDRAIENQEDALDTAISEETSDKINDLYPDMYQDPNFPKIYKMVAKYYNLDYNKCINSIK